MFLNLYPYVTQLTFDKNCAGHNFICTGYDLIRSDRKLHKGPLVEKHCRHRLSDPVPKMASLGVGRDNQYSASELRSQFAAV